MKFPKPTENIVFDKSGKYIGHCIYNDDHLLVDDDYEISIEDAEYIINLMGDTCMPSSYYKLIR